MVAFGIRSIASQFVSESMGHMTGLDVEALHHLAVMILGEVASLPATDAVGKGVTE